MSVNLIKNGGFETGDLTNWSTFIDGGAGASATFSATTSDKYSGNYSCFINIASGGTSASNIQLYQEYFNIVKDLKYKVRFYAKATAARSTDVRVIQTVSPYSVYGLDASVNLTTSWQLYELSFTANTTANDTRFQFRLGGNVEDVYIDDVSLTIDFSLSKNPTVEGYSQTVLFDPVLRSKTDGGYRHTRARFTRVPKKWRLHYTAMSDTDKATMEAFEQACGYGAQSMTWTNPKDGQEYTVRFSKPVEYRLFRTSQLWEFEVELEEV